MQSDLFTQPIDVEKRALIDIARDIAYKNKVPIEHALIWARMPDYVVPK